MDIQINVKNEERHLGREPRPRQLYPFLQIDYNYGKAREPRKLSGNSFSSAHPLALAAAFLLH